MATVVLSEAGQVVEGAAYVLGGTIVADRVVQGTAEWVPGDAAMEIGVSDETFTLVSAGELAGVRLLQSSDRARHGAAPETASLASGAHFEREGAVHVPDVVEGCTPEEAPQANILTFEDGGVLSRVVEQPLKDMLLAGNYDTVLAAAFAFDPLALFHDAVLAQMRTLDPSFVVDVRNLLYQEKVWVRGKDTDVGLHAGLEAVLPRLAAWVAEKVHKVKDGVLSAWVLDLYKYVQEGERLYKGDMDLLWDKYEVAVLGPGFVRGATQQSELSLLAWKLGQVLWGKPVAQAPAAEPAAEPAEVSAEQRAADDMYAMLEAMPPVIRSVWDLSVPLTFSEETAASLRLEEAADAADAQLRWLKQLFLSVRWDHWLVEPKKGVSAQGSGARGLIELKPAVVPQYPLAEGTAPEDYAMGRWQKGDPLPPWLLEHQFILVWLIQTEWLLSAVNPIRGSHAFKAFESSKEEAFRLRLNETDFDPLQEATAVAPHGNFSNPDFGEPMCDELPYYPRGAVAMQPLVWPDVGAGPSAPGNYSTVRSWNLLPYTSQGESSTPLSPGTYNTGALRPRPGIRTAQYDVSAGSSGLPFNVLAFRAEDLTGTHEQPTLGGVHCLVRPTDMSMRDFLGRVLPEFFGYNHTQTTHYIEQHMAEFPNPDSAVAQTHIRLEFVVPASAVTTAATRHEMGKKVRRTILGRVQALLSGFGIGLPLDIARYGYGSMLIQALWVASVYMNISMEVQLMGLSWTQATAYYVGWEVAKNILRRVLQYGIVPSAASRSMLEGMVIDRPYALGLQHQFSFQAVHNTALTAGLAVVQYMSSSPGGIFPISPALQWLLFGVAGLPVLIGLTDMASDTYQRKGLAGLLWSVSLRTAPPTAVMQLGGALTTTSVKVVTGAIETIYQALPKAVAKSMSWLLGVGGLVTVYSDPEAFKAQFEGMVDYLPQLASDAFTPLKILVYLIYAEFLSAHGAMLRNRYIIFAEGATLTQAGAYALPFVGKLLSMSYTYQAFHPPLFMGGAVLTHYMGGPTDMLAVLALYSMFPVAYIWTRGVATIPRVFHALQMEQRSPVLTAAAETRALIYTSWAMLALWWMYSWL